MHAKYHSACQTVFSTPPDILLVYADQPDIVESVERTSVKLVYLEADHVIDRQGKYPGEY